MGKYSLIVDMVSLLHKHDPMLLYLLIIDPLVGLYPTSFNLPDYTKY